MEGERSVELAWTALAQSLPLTLRSAITQDINTVSPRTRGHALTTGVCSEGWWEQKELECVGESTGSRKTPQTQTLRDFRKA